MAIDWQGVITTVSGTAVISGLVAWLIKSAVTQGFTLQAETFKKRLEIEGDAEIENLKHALQMTAAEHQLRYASSQQKRAEVIADLYSRAVDMSQESQRYILVEAYIQDEQKHREASAAADAKLYDFFIFVEKHQIYLPEKTSAVLDDLVSKMRTHVVTVASYARISGYATPEVIKERSDAFKAAYRAFADDIPALRTRLQDDFRTILGVNSSARPTTRDAEFPTRA